MMSQDIPAGSVPIGATSTTSYFRLGEVVLSLPDDAAVDNLESALENRRWQEAYAQDEGAFGLVVFVDRLASQDREARTTYAEMTSDTLNAVALVTQTLLSRAIASFFFGMTRPSVPYRTFQHLSDAIDWLENGEYS